MIRRAACALALAGVFGASTTAMAEGVPGTITFTARLARDGQPATGPHSFIFKLFDAQAAGNEVWGEQESTLNVDNGLVFRQLGTLTTFDDEDFDGGRRWLELTVDGITMEPRIPVLSVPYAFRAGVAATAEAIGAILPEDLVTSVTTSGGLTAVRTGNAVSLGVDSATVQRRITGACAAGQAIRAIATDGTVACEEDTDTTYTDGAGVHIVGTSLTVDTTTIQARVTGSCPLGQAIRGIAANGTVTCEEDTDTTYSATVGSGIVMEGTSLRVDTTTIQARVTGSCPPGQAVMSVGADGSVACASTTYAVGDGLAFVGDRTVGLDFERANTWTGRHTFSGGAVFPDVSTEAGWVGIGTTTPDAPLEVFDGRSTGASIQIGGHTVTLQGVNDPVAAYPRLPYVQWLQGDGTRAMYLGWGDTTYDGGADTRRHIEMSLENGYSLGIGGGNVGIGTNAPDHALHVVGTAPFAFKLEGGGMLVYGDGGGGDAASAVIGKGGIDWNWGYGVLGVYDTNVDRKIEVGSNRGSGRKVDVYLGLNGSTFVGPPVDGAPVQKLNVNGRTYTEGVQMRNYGKIMVRYGGGDARSTVPWTPEEVLANPGASFMWAANGPELRDTGACAEGLTPSALVDNRLDMGWPGQYWLTFSSHAGTAVIQGTWSGWELQLWDSANNLIGGAAHSRVEFGLQYTGGAWRLQHMSGQIGDKLFECR